MYVSIGGGCLVRTAEIIGIFAAKGGNNILNIKLKNRRDDNYEVEDISENGMIGSIVLTDKKIFLSGISASTLQKRINQNTVYYNGGNNG
ncbi:MAG: extracellular matrix/biofilm biosynthesis regulator RemA family protein [Succiniclasticum sp.]|jgi:hypothetical protein